MPPKTVAVLGAVCLTTGWLLASMLTPPVAKLQSLPERRTGRAAVAANEPAAAFAEHLHLRMQQAPVAPVPRRNPFTFGSEPRAAAGGPVSASGPRAALGAPEAPMPVVDVPTGPIYSLSGIGATDSPDGRVLTAVLSDGNTVYLVKAGDQLGAYKVVAVTDDSATIADAGGAQVVLRLR